VAGPDELEGTPSGTMRRAAGDGGPAQSATSERRAVCHRGTVSGAATGHIASTIERLRERLGPLELGEPPGELAQEIRGAPRWRLTGRPLTP